MLRITEFQENDTAIRLRLDGTLSSDSFRDLENMVAQHQSASGRTVILDMSGVDFITDEPARQLGKLGSESLRIINCSPFILTLLETLNGEGAGK
jgi:anti-anti-sigma regulatory factor